MADEDVELFPEDDVEEAVSVSDAYEDFENGVEAKQLVKPRQTKVEKGPTVTRVEEFGGDGNATYSAVMHSSGTFSTYTEGQVNNVSVARVTNYAKGGIINHSGADTVNITEGTVWDAPQSSKVTIAGNPEARKNAFQELANRRNSEFFAARAGFKYNKTQIDLLNLDEIFNWDLTNIMRKAWKAPLDFKFTEPQAGGSFVEKLALLTMDTARFYSACLTESFKEAGKMFTAVLEEKAESLQRKYDAICKFGEDGVFKQQMDKALKSGDPSAFFKICMNPAQGEADLKKMEKDNEKERDDANLQAANNSMEKNMKYGTEAKMEGR